MDSTCQMITGHSRRKGPVIIIFAAAKTQFRFSPVLRIFPHYDTDSSIAWTKPVYFNCRRIHDFALAMIQNRFWWRSLLIILLARLIQWLSKTILIRGVYYYFILYVKNEWMDTIKLLVHSECVGCQTFAIGRMTNTWL